MTDNNLISFITYMLISTFTPGPNNIMAMSLAGKEGFKKSIKFNLGVGFGYLILIPICGICLSWLINIIPDLKNILKILGSVYIVYLAYLIIKDKKTNNDEKKTKHAEFFQGMLLQFINPKGVIFVITAFSTFIFPYHNSQGSIYLFAITLAVLTLISTCLWALFGSAFNTFMAKYQKLINIGMALALLWCAVSIILH